MKAGQNGLSTTPIGTTPTPNPIYSMNVKNPVDIKSPQLPFGENVAVATSTGGP